MGIKLKIMEKVTNPKVKLLSEGEKLTAKQMKAKAGDLLPKHTANLESVLVVMEGVCVLTLDKTDHTLNPGDSFVVPAAIIHQIRAIEDFRAVHIMPKEIAFTFYK